MQQARRRRYWRCRAMSIRVTMVQHTTHPDSRDKPAPAWARPPRAADHGRGQSSMCGRLPGGHRRPSMRQERKPPPDRLDSTAHAFPTDLRLSDGVCARPYGWSRMPASPSSYVRSRSTMTMKRAAIIYDDWSSKQLHPFAVTAFLVPVALLPRLAWHGIATRLPLIRRLLSVHLEPLVRPWSPRLASPPPPRPAVRQPDGLTGNPRRHQRPSATCTTDVYPILWPPFQQVPFLPVMETEHASRRATSDRSLAIRLAIDSAAPRPSSASLARSS
ncbi:hypothetical protein CDD83_2919 [Cordyceps sp. RAO-2017]|nr:hypothetical protein CDD83_2919 [Cordyceps sp. RAO-2017]